MIHSFFWWNNNFIKMYESRLILRNKINRKLKIVKTGSGPKWPPLVCSWASSLLKKLKYPSFVQYLSIDLFGILHSSICQHILICFWLKSVLLFAANWPPFQCKSSHFDDSILNISHGLLIIFMGAITYFFGHIVFF